MPNDPYFSNDSFAKKNACDLAFYCGY